MLSREAVRRLVEYVDAAVDEDGSLIKIEDIEKSWDITGIYPFLVSGNTATTVRTLEYFCLIKSFKPEFTIVIFIHYKPRIAVAILDL